MGLCRPFSTIQIASGIRSAPIQILTKWLLQIFVDDTTAVLSWHVQILVCDNKEWNWREANFPSNHNHQRQFVSENKPRKLTRL